MRNIAWSRELLNERFEKRIRIAITHAQQGSLPSEDGYPHDFFRRVKIADFVPWANSQQWSMPDELRNLAKTKASDYKPKSESQVEAILAAVRALGFQNDRIPWDKKSAVKDYCFEHYQGLFSESHDSFDHAWKSAPVRCVRS